MLVNIEEQYLHGNLFRFYSGLRSNSRNRVTANASCNQHGGISEATRTQRKGSVHEITTSVRLLV